MPLGLVLWIIALILTISGLVAVLRYRLTLGAFLIVAGIALGLSSNSYLD